MNRSPIPISGQLSVLRALFPGGCVVSSTSRHMVWEMNISPTPNSRMYRIRIEYDLDKSPRVYVVRPQQLEKLVGCNSLPHVYSTPEQRICLYYPLFKEWEPTKFIAKTIVPWASEWLLFYEIWLASGEWCGEGIHCDNKKSGT